MALAAKVDPASFKDSEGQVFHSEGRVFRTLSATARERVGAMLAGACFESLVGDRVVLPARLVNAADEGLDPVSLTPALLEHERLDLVSYPYEWSFAMLRDAALVTLEVMRRVLGADLILKDGTPFNVMPHRGRMMFIDILSIDQYREGQVWEGYGQFCRQFLFPLMAAAHTGLDFRAFLRGKPDGMSAHEIKRLLGAWGWRHKGVLRHVVAQAVLDRSFAESAASVQSRTGAGVLSKTVLLRLVDNLTAVIGSLKLPGKPSHWLGYTDTRTYSDADAEAKRQFVGHSLAAFGRGLRLVDLGCNTGEFSLEVAKHGGFVASIDTDASCIDALYQRVRGQSVNNIIPLVNDVTNPSPAQGWALSERPSLFDRLATNRFLALALVHHVCIAGNVPLSYFVDMLTRFGGGGVVEWVDKTDPMVQHLLRNRADIFGDYHWDAFKAELDRCFVIEACLELQGGRRRLCCVRQR